MAIVRSYGAVQTVTGTAPAVTAGGGSIGLYGASPATYAALYRLQPNVRTVVDFLSRNVAQLGYHVFRRLSDTDRQRLNDHQLATWVGKPNPGTSRYRQMESTMGDLGIYFNAYWVKVRVPDRIGLLRLPAAQMHAEGGLLPRKFVWTNDNGVTTDFPTSEIVHFGGFDPSNPLMGFSPLETLRRVLAEEAAAGEYRESYWANAGRFEGVIERPLAAPRWTVDQKKSWRQQWQEAFGRGGTLAGTVGVLEDGMTLKSASFSAKDAEYLSARKLTREECAAAYHVPLPLVGILEHATFSNIKEQHKHLYADCLGPWLVMLGEEIERQLLIECDDQADVYSEFNIAEKLKGSFEEQAASLQALVGRPIMTANEGRARLNLPRDPDPSSDKIAAQQGGPAAPPAPAPAAPADDDTDAVASAMQAAWGRQRARLAKLPIGERPAAFLAAQGRYHRELVEDLTPIVGADAATAYATVANAQMLALLQAEADDA